MQDDLPLVPPDALTRWVAEQPLQGPETAWRHWWDRGSGLDRRKAATDVIGAGLTCGTGRDGAEPQCLQWAVPALLHEFGGEWLLEPLQSRGVSHPTALHGLAYEFRDWGWAIRAAAVTDPEVWAQRRRLFQTVMAAVPESAHSLLTPEASEKAREPFRELGSRLLGVAYRLEAWPEAELLERLGQTPDGPSPAYATPAMRLAGVAAWERALGQGWDPLAAVKRGTLAYTEVRWRLWIGPWFPKHNETNDPLIAHVIAWARRHDPKGFRAWCLEGARQALKAEVTADTIQESLLSPWWPQTLNDRAEEYPSYPWWYEAVLTKPDEWWPRLKPYINSGFLIEPQRGRSLKNLNDATIPRLRKLPELDQQCILALLRAPNPNDRSPPRSSDGSFWWGTLQPEHIPWLASHLSAQELWGDPTESVQHAVREAWLRRWRHSMEWSPDAPQGLHQAQRLVEAHRVHPIPNSWQPLLALCAVALGQLEAVPELVHRGLTLQNLEAALQEYGDLPNVPITETAEAIRAIHQSQGLSECLHLGAMRPRPRL